MAKPIDQIPELGRPLITGDLFVVEAPEGTRSVKPERVRGAMKPPHFFTATGGETEITVPDLETSTWSFVLLSGAPLQPHAGPLPVPPGMYKPDYPQSRILLGNSMYAEERIVILHY